MALEKVESAEKLKPMDLKALINAKTPCITVCVPFDNRDAGRIRLKNIVKQLEHDVPAGTGKADREELLAPLRELAEAMPRAEGAALALFRSPDVFTSIWLKQPVPEGVTIADHFMVRNIIPQLTGERRFYILALAQKGIRLIRCNDHSSEEVALPAGTPHSWDEWFAPAKPDHVLDNMSSGGPSTGSMKGVMAGTGTEREDKDEYLRHFYRAIEKGVREALRADPAPLVLAGVEYELSLYHEMDTYERTVPGGVK